MQAGPASKAARIRTALILASVALAFFVGALLKYGLLK
jgi:hypothetical protein